MNFKGCWTPAVKKWKITLYVCLSTNNQAIETLPTKNIFLLYESHLAAILISTIFIRFSCFTQSKLLPCIIFFCVFILNEYTTSPQAPEQVSRDPIHIHLTTHNVNLTLQVGWWIKLESPWQSIYMICLGRYQ